MREQREENIKIDDFSMLLYNDYYENENKKINKEINVNIFDSEKKNVENYKLLNEEEEILLCKEEVIKKIKSKKENQEENIKIKELFNGEDDNSIYYLNKKEIKKKLFKNTSGLEDDGDGNSIDNHNRAEMEKLYKEVQLKHPRKVVDGKIKKFSFFSWSGFFCCNKSDYLSLGQGYTTYFNTIKLLIIFFLIISLINIYLIKLFYQFTTVYDFKDDSLLKTTLGNTIIRYFNTNSIFINKNESYSSMNISLDCGENIIDDVVLIRRYLNASNKFDYLGIGLKELSIISRFDLKYNFNYLNSYFRTRKISVYYAFDIYKCKNKNKCIIEIEDRFYDLKVEEDYNNMTDIFIYSCIKKISYDNGNYTDKELFLSHNVANTNLVILLILILFYSVYKKLISIDNKEYQKKKLFINNFTLVLHELKIISDDYNQELSDLISFLNDIIKNNKNLLLPLSNQINYGEINDFNVFDISISNVNQKKLIYLEK